MFQAWNVADISSTDFGIPKWVTGLILTAGVGLVILGTVRDEVEARGQLRVGNRVFIVLQADANSETGLDQHRLTGELREDAGTWLAVFPAFAAAQNASPTIAVPARSSISRAQH